jgi:tRNA pseudouridine55 synthase
MATGVLPILVNRGVKASEFMLSSDKHYIATLRLGLTTDTEDITGSTLSVSDTLPTEDEVMRATDSFVGRYMQTPPMYSALKRDGKKLYDLARAGITVEREAREVWIHSILCTPTARPDEYTLDVKCSKGTYIRTLCADIGASLGCGGCMASLCRAEASGFTLSDAHTLAELEALSPAEREALIVPVEDIFRDCVRVELAPFFARLARSGLEIYLKKVGLELPLGARATLFDENGFFALGEVRRYDDGLAIKPIRQF